VSLAWHAAPDSGVQPISRECHEDHRIRLDRPIRAWPRRASRERLRCQIFLASAGRCRALAPVGCARYVDRAPSSPAEKPAGCGRSGLLANAGPLHKPDFGPRLGVAERAKLGFSGLVALRTRTGVLDSRGDALHLTCLVRAGVMNMLLQLLGSSEHCCSGLRSRAG
jgi:hypothetical protein